MRQVVLVLLAMCLGPVGASASDNALPLDSWTLLGKGRRVEPGILEVAGTGSDSSEWRGPYTFEPGKLYHFQARVRRPGGAGTVIAGPDFANRDYTDVSAEWGWVGHVFRVPEAPGPRLVRVGQWCATGTVQCDAVRICGVLPVHRRAGPLLLGDGELVRSGRYEFCGSFEHEGSNYHRTLDSATAAFNSNRWCFGGRDQVTYRFALPGRRFLSGEVEFMVCYHGRGGCAAEVSRDGGQWRPLVTQNGLGTGHARLPAELLPAEVLFVRLRTATGESSFQVDRVAFRAAVEGSLPDAAGTTVYAEVRAEGREPAIRGLTFSAGDAENRSTLVAELNGAGGKPLQVECRSVVRQGGRALPEEKTTVAIPAGRTASWVVPIAVDEPGQYTCELSARAAPGGGLRVDVPVVVPDYYRTDYGERIAADSPQADVWWCDAMHKVPRRRALPKLSGTAARIAAARHEFEPVQIVVRPRQPLRRLTAAAGPLAGPNGARIESGAIQVLRVCYHFVSRPTDGTGLRDLWPDALPPLDRPIDVPAGENQPLWILVHVPRDAPAGDYSGAVALAADGWSARVPIHLHVWNFTLPEQSHLESGYGLSPETIFQYHQLRGETDKRRVLDMYLQSFADHRINPYLPAPLDPIRVKFLPKAAPPRAEVDFSAFDPAMSSALAKYHFNSFMLPIEGMGGGTFQFRDEPGIAGYGERTPEYQAMFASYVRQLEAHLREKGWLKMAYVYWFDEPDTKDFAFVRNGMERLHRYAPGLTRLLTKEPRGVLPGCVDLWCTLTPQYDAAAAQACRARGERFWWYVCCGPKAPFCTLFIDHPATELRVWNWQTWQRGIAGTLIWSTNYWTSPTAFPQQPQNPYEDPMGYVGDGALPPGTKAYWGNGDGRMLYPPEAAATPGASGADPVLQPPVASIRWEMLREGVEDYEYLWLLGQRLAACRARLTPLRVKQLEALLSVPAAITRDMTHFTTDPAPIYARRAEIAEGIESLGLTSARAGAADSTDLALNKPASSSSIENDEHGAAKANDGDPETCWRADDEPEGGPEWWQVDLEKPSDLSGCQIRWPFAGKRYRYKVEGSTDRKTWSLLSDQTSTASTSQIHDLKFQTARQIRYVRITVTGLDEGCWASISEIKVFGSKHFEGLP